MKQLFTLFSLFMVGVAVAQPNRAVKLTGNVATDFKAVERTSGSGFAYALSWDSRFVYIGVTGGGSYIKDEPTLVYFSKMDGNGADSSFGYDNRRGALPFKGNAVVYFKNGYAEVRRDSAAGFWGWSGNTVVTDSIKTGTNDIEIKISWKNLFGTSTVPADLAAIFYKTNGNGSMNDAYEVRPGIVNEDNDTYTGNVFSTPIQTYYRFRTERSFYSGLNMFSWIVKPNSNCTAPTQKPASLITNISARLNWSDLTTDAQLYQVRYRAVGTTLWKTTQVAKTKRILNLTNLTCNTSYEWIIRTLCDTVGNDIGSAFSAPGTFTTATCFSARGINGQLIDENGVSTQDVTVYPVPVRKGARMTVASPEFRSNATFAIFNTAGIRVQQGIINNGAVNVNGSVPAGTYVLELRNTNSVVRKRIVVMQ